MALKSGYQGIKKLSEQFNLTTEGSLSLNVENDPGAGGSLPISGDAAKILDQNIQTNRQLTVNKVDNSVIAPVENGAKCQNPDGYAIGEHFLRNGGFFTVTSAIAYDETITEGTNCVKGKISKRQRLTSISDVFSALPAGTNEVIAVASGTLVAAITNNEIVSDEGVIVFQKNNNSSFKWYGIIGSTTFAMGVCQNNAYISHRVIYRDTTSETVTTDNQDVTLHTTYKSAIRYGKIVEFKVRFTLANDISEGTNVTLFTFPYLPSDLDVGTFAQYYQIIAAVSPYDNVGVGGGIAKTTGKFIINANLPAGTYEVGGTYICQ